MITIDINYDELADALAQRLNAAVSTSPWLTVKQAASHIGASERWLRDRLCELPHSRVEGRIFVNRNELDRWLLAQSR
jgi:hypothetical protein